MGGGGGCVIETITLEKYQQRVGDLVMTVDTDTNIYTFLSGISDTIDRCLNIAFAENDRLVIAQEAKVTLEGTLTIEKETVTIIRITVNGSLTIEEGSAITFGTIKEGGIGIVVNSSNSLYINGGEITIDTVKDGDEQKNIYSSAIRVNSNGSVIKKTGLIKINRIVESAIGIFVNENNATFTQEGGCIEITSVDNSIGVIIQNEAKFI